MKKILIIILALLFVSPLIVGAIYFQNYIIRKNCNGQIISTMSLAKKCIEKQ